MNAASYTSELELAAQADAVRWGRRHTRDVLSAWQLPDERIDDAQLAVSELVTNAVRYVGTTSLEAVPPRIRLTLHKEPHRLLVWVTDPSNKPPILNAAPTAGAENGRGLLILERITKEWSYYFLPTGGKVVWCSIALG
ncbi:regulator [Streptomyces sp. MUSC 125]|uniref:ATP-binding protein n=1 Tax=Streptomyces sp. MUSC 125 TaxID=1428624 RepID=UPI00057EA65C|nr:ATP-binding protein [Streptomyces sp. MUSC 125]KIE25714.1 regulator [Streptomyces sp. MUSC 125]